MASDPAYLTRTTNALLWLDRNHFILAEQDKTVVRCLHNSSIEILENTDQCLRLDGLSVCIWAQGDGCYYHWMVDAFPKLGILSLAGVELDKVDHFIVNPLVRPFHMESLEKLGIKREQIIETTDQSKFYCEELIDIELPNFVGMTMQRFVPEFLRSSFLNEYVRKDGQRLVYVGRPKGMTRRAVENEEELVCLLRAYGFEHVLMEGLTLPAQAGIFNSAKVIISPHGGALTNLVYCEPGSQVIELFANHVFSYFYGLANLCRLKYAAILRSTDRADRLIDPNAGNVASDPHITIDEPTIPVDLSMVERAIIALGVTSRA